MKLKEQHASFTLPALGILCVLLVLSCAGNYVLYTKVQHAAENPQQQGQEAVHALVQEVSQYIVLPEGEDPTVATVTDPEKLKDQAFFTQASVGDKVLIYTNAKKAILYNPGTHKIVEVAPINIGTGSPSPSAPAPTPAPEEVTEEESAQ